MHGRIRFGLPKVHGRICIGLPKVHGRIRSGLPKVHGRFRAPAPPPPLRSGRSWGRPSLPRRRSRWPGSGCWWSCLSAEASSTTRGRRTMSWTSSSPSCVSTSRIFIFYYFCGPSACPINNPMLLAHLRFPMHLPPLDFHSGESRGTIGIMQENY